MCRRSETTQSVARSLWIAAAIVALAGGGARLGAQDIPDDPNPQGFILTSGYNLLFPLGNPYGCDGGGQNNLLRAWLAPRAPETETARPGDEWNDIDFGGAAAATGFEASEFYAELGESGAPVWHSLSSLQKLGSNLPQTPPALPNVDGVGFQLLLNELNTNWVSQLPGTRRLPTDNVVGAAQTFIENNREGVICASLCVASDDSIQIWLNGVLVQNTSACRGLDQGCAEISPVEFLPGMNRLTVLCWEGVGDWSFRIAVRDGQGQLLSNNNQDELTFHGAEPPQGNIGGAFSVRRTVANPDCCPAGEFVRVSLRGSGPRSGNVTLIEEYSGDQPVEDVANVTAGGEVISFGENEGFFIRWTVPASTLRSTGVRYDLKVTPGAEAIPVGFLEPCFTRIVGEPIVKGALPNSGPIGILDDSHAIGRATDLADGLGSLSFSAGRDGEVGTPDDRYTMVGAGADIWNTGDSFHFGYRELEGNFRVRVRIASRGFPQSGGRWGRYGLMARRDCAPNSQYSMVHANLEADPGPNADHPQGDAVFWQFRRAHRTDGGNDNAQSVFFPDPDGNGPLQLNQPNWFRLERRGSTFFGYASFDGDDWKLIGSNTWPDLAADDAVLVGIAYSKHSSASNAGTVVFSNLEYGESERAEIFDNDRNRPGRVIFQNNFNNVANNTLPAQLQGNCAFNCDGAGGFRPRVINGRLRLTQEGVGDNATSVFLRTPLPADSGALVIEYTAFARHSGITGQPVLGDPNPADGMTMSVIAGNDPGLVGDGGGGLGYNGIGRGFDRARPSLSVEADTWAGAFNNEGTGAPENDGTWHLGINTGGNLHSVAINKDPLPDLFAPEGVRHRVVITSEGKVSVFLLGDGRAGGVDDGEPAAEATVEPLGASGEMEAVVGFTGATGGASQTSEIDDVTVTVLECDDNPERAEIDGPAAADPGDEIRLDARRSTAGAGDADETLTYNWTAVRNVTILSDPTLPEITARVGDGEVIVRVEVDDGHCRNSDVEEFMLDTSGGDENNWVSYDLNGDGLFDISDPAWHFNFLFGTGGAPRCQEAADFNLDGERNIADPIAALNFLFGRGFAPRRGLGCQSYPTCGAGAGCP